MSARLYHRIVHFFRTLLAKIYHRGTTEDSNIMLPTSSAIYAQGITIKVYSPPDDSFPVKHLSHIGDSEGISTQSSAWLRDKENFLRSPILSRAKDSGDERQTKDALSSPHTQANACHGGFAPPGSQLQSIAPITDIGAKSWDSNVTPSGRSFPTPSASTGPPPSAHLNVAGRPRLPYDEYSRSLDRGLDSGCAERTAGSTFAQDSTIAAFGTSNQVLQSTLGPIQYTSDALFRLFWDPPSHFTQSPARMVPMPSYTHLLSRSTSSTAAPLKPRLSLLPYPNLFDFAMYDSRAPYTSTANFSSSGLPADRTVHIDPALPSEAPSDAHSCNYKITALPKISYDNVPTKTRRSSQKLGLQDLNLPSRTSNVARSSITSNLAAETDTSDGWNLVSLEDVS